MSSVFQLNENELLTFFVVFIRFASMIAIFPLFGDQAVPAPLKVLFALALTVVVYPVLIEMDLISVAAAEKWGSSSFMLIRTIAAESIFGVILGWVSRLAFDAIQIGGSLIGVFMGLSSASVYDPSQESHSQLIGKFQTTLAMIVFLVVDGHHHLLEAAISSYKFVALGTITIAGGFIEQILGLTAQTIRTGLQVAAPMAISLFSVNIVYAVMAKAMPQLNVLVLSFSVSALIGLFVLYFSTPEFIIIAKDLFGLNQANMTQVMRTLGGS